MAPASRGEDSLGPVGIRSNATSALMRSEKWFRGTVSVGGWAHTEYRVVAAVAGDADKADLVGFGHERGPGDV